MQLKDAHGRDRQVSYRDRQQVSFRVNTSSYLSTLRITRAIYGSAYRSSDVTSRLNSQIQGNQLQMRVNNDSMGGDPSPNQAKTLSVQYAVNGRANQVIVNEGDVL